MLHQYEGEGNLEGRGNGFPNTGWSKVTVTNNISLTNLKNAKNCLTQGVLETFYAVVLVFWCPKMIRWEKMVHFSVAPKWTDNYTLVQLLKFWHTRKSSWMFKYVWLYLLCLMLLRMSWGCLRKSFVVWAVFWGWQSCLGVFCGYLRFSPYRVESCWSQPTNLVQHWNVKKILTWSFWDIKIPKQPHKSFLKITGLGNFLHFLGSSERYYLLQLLLITLYLL